MSLAKMSSGYNEPWHPLWCVGVATLPASAGLGGLSESLSCMHAVRLGALPARSGVAGLSESLANIATGYAPRGVSRDF